MRIGWQADQIQGPLRRFESRLARANPVLAIKSGDDDIFQNRQPVDRPGYLESPPDPGMADTVRQIAADLLALETHRAFGRLERPRDHVEDRALTRPIRSDQAKDFAFLDLKRDLIDGGKTAEALNKRLDGENRFGHGCYAPFPDKTATTDRLEERSLMPIT